MNNINSKIKIVFWTLVGIFIILVSYFTIPTAELTKQAIFPFAAVLSLLFFLLGGILMFLTLRGEVKGSIKKYLLLTSYSAVGFLVSVILHNAFYALGEIASKFSGLIDIMIVLHYVAEILDVGFFLMGIFVCPIGFLVGITGTVILLIKKHKKQRSKSD